jgi:hypothetical protein
MVFGDSDVWCRLYNLLKESDDGDEKERDGKEEDGKERYCENIIKEFRELYFKELDMTILAVRLSRLPQFGNFLLKFPYLREQFLH